MKKFNLDQAKEIFSGASMLMQNFIIGYIKVGDRFEPAVSESETFMPLSSFGISNVYISDKFIPFPDGKNLTQMLRSPLEYHEWCKENLK